MNRTNPEVDKCFSRAVKWRAELEKLREIVLASPLTEELKWDKPFYTFARSNVLVLWGFKDHCALGFCRGALLKDPQGILSKIGENTQSARKIRFTAVQQILDLEPVLQAYISEAIAIAEAGLEVVYKQTSDFVWPAEVADKLAQNPALKAAFEKLTPGRQRGYILHFSAPKQSKTRLARLEQCAPRIFAGKGYNER